MVVERWRQIQSLFHAACERTGEDCVHFLAGECSADPALRREVESLLENEDLAAGFLESAESDAPATAGHEPVLAGERIGPARGWRSSITIFVTRAAVG